MVVLDVVLIDKIFMPIRREVPVLVFVQYKIMNVIIELEHILVHRLITGLDDNHTGLLNFRVQILRIHIPPQLNTGIPHRHFLHLINSIQINLILVIEILVQPELTIIVARPIISLFGQIV
jgi:hypothetical protein